MRQPFRPALLVGALVCAIAAPVQAAPLAVDWADAFRLQSSGAGLVDPIVLIGFNPQPDPPVRITTLDLRDPTAPSLIIAGQTNPQQFILFLAIGVGELYGGPDTLTMDFDLPALTGEDLSSYLFRARGDGSVHDVSLTFATTTLGILDGTSIVGFNPQPDPPVDFAAFDVLGLQFSFTSLSDASVTLRMTDAAGTPLSFAAAAAPVPEPATLTLVGLGATALGWTRRRRQRRQRATPAIADTGWRARL